MDAEWKPEALCWTRKPESCVVILYHLEAAIQGVEIKGLNEKCKLELKEWFKQLQTAD